MVISTAPDLSGSSRVDMTTRPVAAGVLLQRKLPASLSHKYLIRGSVGTHPPESYITKKKNVEGVCSVSTRLVPRDER